VLDTTYTTNPLGDGRNALILNNPANGIDIVPPGGEALLGTFLGPNRTSPPVVLYDCEVECGGTVFNAFLQALPGDSFSLQAYPRELIALRVVPEPLQAALLALAFTAVCAARMRRPARALPRS
jgi:hypothetical protein